MNDELRIGLIADDFTGAMDAGVTFAAAGLPTVFALTLEGAANSGDDMEAAAFVLSTDSREVETALARVRAVQATAQIVDRQIFKKIDSTMRGNIGVEVQAILDQTSLSKAVICPAAIGVGRTVRDGQLTIHGEPLHHTAFAHDPTWPASTASVADLLRMPASTIGLPVVRQGVEALSQAVQKAAHRLVTIDAESEADLAVIAQAAIEGPFLPCGSMGLAGAWIKALAGEDRASDTTLISPTGRQHAPVLVIAGSRHPLTHRQIADLTGSVNSAILTIGPETQLPDAQHNAARALRQHPVVVIRPPLERLPAPAMGAVQTRINALARSLGQAGLFNSLVLIGGETGAAVCRNLAIEGIQLLGEVEAGIPLGRIRGGCADSGAIITKAGAFGHEDSLTAVVQWLLGG